MHNVAGLLRGSDPMLRDTYVILSAHYDHVGLAATGEDRIMNGANDDASGTVSVIEVARALAAIPQRPARSILFITFFGEERGLLGSRYYGQHPLAPVERTVAHLNLEQVGRTDATEGMKIKTANLTGFDFSGVTPVLVEAAAAAGVQILKDDASSDAFFSRSDNQPLADMGVPAHTLSVAYQFPDYHKASDEWDRIDYANMAEINRAIALGVMRLASDAAPPQWNASYAPAARYVEAARRLHAGE
jgi:Zn-dependent M28 family amino/carboxypeptidase